MKVEDYILYICDVGIFIDVYSSDKAINRKKLKSVIEEMLTKIGVNRYRAMPYSMDELTNWY